MRDLFVLRVLANRLGAIGAEHVTGALMQLTGLQILYLDSTWLRCCWIGGVVRIAG